jgi:hypothetical protein
MAQQNILKSVSWEQGNFVDEYNKKAGQYCFAPLKNTEDMALRLLSDIQKCKNRLKFSEPFPNPPEIIRNNEKKIVSLDDLEYLKAYWNIMS